MQHSLTLAVKDTEYWIQLTTIQITCQGHSMCPICATLQARDYKSIDNDLLRGCASTGMWNT